MTTKIVGRVAPGATAAEISKSWIGNRTVSWSEEAGYDANGKPKTDRKTQDVPVVPAEFLSDELGLRRDVLDRPFVRALILGHAMANPSSGNDHAADDRRCLNGRS
jgi:hypothetical protein